MSSGKRQAAKKQIVKEEEKRESKHNERVNVSKKE